LEHLVWLIVASRLADRHPTLRRSGSLLRHCHAIQALFHRL